MQVILGALLGLFLSAFLFFAHYGAGFFEADAPQELTPRDAIAQSDTEDSADLSDGTHSAYWEELAVASAGFSPELGGAFTEELAARIEGAKQLSVDGSAGGIGIFSSQAPLYADGQRIGGFDGSSFYDSSGRSFLSCDTAWDKTTHLPRRISRGATMLASLPEGGRVAECEETSCLLPRAGQSATVHLFWHMEAGDYVVMPYVGRYLDDEDDMDYDYIEDVQGRRLAVVEKASNWKFSKLGTRSVEISLSFAELGQVNAVDRLLALYAAYVESR